MRASKVPRWTRSPVCTGNSRISPEAFDLTSTTVSGRTAPAAWTVTEMSRVVTGTAWYTGSGSSLAQAAASATSTASREWRSTAFTRVPPRD